MGEVYRARDPRLNRDVAVKVLAHAGADPVRQRRFLDEAQSASALNHPNIVTVYDVGTHEGAPYIVSEVVEGLSVRQLLGRGPMTVREVLDLGVQMADGLAAAHQAGIVHRDFKPENVMVTRDGRVKILDFGLALVGMRDGVSAPEVDVTLTATGVIVGTVPYMSPEQARGATVDFRTDQFSLGLTLYEMVTGRRAYSKETAAQILAAILDDEPEPIAKLNARVPAPLRWVIERCLAKDPRQRYDATADLTRELRTLRDHLPEFVPSTEIEAPPDRRRPWTIAVAALAVVVAAGAAALIASRRGDDGLERYRFTPFATDAGYQASPSWSPDSKTLAYIADVDGILQVFTRPLGSSLRQQVTHARFHCAAPFWSPDGTRLYYISLARDRDGLWSISAAGGEAELVMEDVSQAALSPDGKTLAFFRDEADGRMKLFFSSPAGSSPVRFASSELDAVGWFVQATLRFSPDGSKLAAWVERGQHNVLGAEFWVVSMADRTAHRVPFPVADVAGLAPTFSWLPDSRHVVSALPSPMPGMHLWLLDIERATARLLTTTGGFENDPAVSPDGKRLALSLQDADFDLYELSAEHPDPTVMLGTSRNEMDPVWSPMGTEMAFTTDRSGRGEIWLRSRKGDWERPLVTPSDFGANSTYMLSAPAFSPDGQRIAYSRAGADGYQVWITPIAGGPPVRLAPSQNAQDWPSWSPDGAWVAYTHVTEAGTDNTWSLSKMRVGARTPPVNLASDAIPFTPVQWSPDAAWIAYNSVNGLSIVPPGGAPARALHEQGWVAFAWSSDSQRLYGFRQSDDFQHLTFTSVDLRTGAEAVLREQFAQLPMSGQPVRGMTRTSPATFLASIERVRSDLWLLEGFQPEATLWDRLTAALSFRKR
jgi:eukaryotic-like serine/threonine-protein kinase